MLRGAYQSASKRTMRMQGKQPESYAHSAASHGASRHGAQKGLGLFELDRRMDWLSGPNAKDVDSVIT